MSEAGKKVYRTTRGEPISFKRTEATTDATTDAEAKPEHEEVTDDAQDLSPRAKRRAERLREFFKSPIKASAASTPKQKHTTSLREYAFDRGPSDYRSLLKKIRNRGGE